MCKKPWLYVRNLLHCNWKFRMFLEYKQLLLLMFLVDINIETELHIFNKATVCLLENTYWSL